MRLTSQKNFPEQEFGRVGASSALEICLFRAEFFIQRIASQNVHRGYFLDILMPNINWYQIEVFKGHETHFMKSIMNNVLHYVMSRVRTGFDSKTEKLAVCLETFRQGDKVGFLQICNFTLLF